MAAMSNEAEAAAWNGPRGEHWVSIQGTLDAMMAEVLDLVLSGADLQPSEAVLDIGCGAGATTIAAARRIGAEGSVLGLDISEPLLRHAKLRAQAEGLSNVTFQLDDAQTYPLKSGNFNVLISRFG
ncbi:methyltransferase domain-containing protein [Solirhodobacter olei]|uniref:methyltransferase domain-containing protein n=1 Tax=Solirhodobacter olei TaxID=2493082 RepID=UPI0013E2B0D5|nr:methyltransferase domain-containing protein [Solirhodobacter olei]